MVWSDDVRERRPVDATDARADTPPCPPDLLGLRVGDAMVCHPKLLDPSTTVAQVRAFFEDDHVHAALLVDDGRLVSVVERADLDAATGADQPAAAVGTLEGRLVGPDADLPPVWSDMTVQRRRRLAVVGEQGDCLGLLCLKRSGLGFCSDEGVAARAASGG